MGYMRNYGLSQAQGEVVLFLDDDTVIMDSRFLSKLYDMFEDDSDLMAVIPRGNPSYCLLAGKYSFHDPYFFTNRCMAYRRSCMKEMKGFDSNFIGQGDVEFSIRFLAKGYRFLTTDEIQYFHPPLIVQNISKAEAVGYSFSKAKYGPLLKFILGINGIRWLPRVAIPTKKNRYMAAFSMGFLVGFIKGLSGMKPGPYA